MEDETAGRSWKAGLLLLAAVAALGIGTFALMGSQVSGILSTVGSSVGPPGGAGPWSGDVDPGSADGGDSDAPVDGDGSSGDEQSEGGQGGEVAEVALLDVQRPDLLILKTGEIALQVQAISPAVALATRTIDGLGGYLSGSSRSGSGADAAASGTFRIPAARWDEALVATRAIGTVLDEHSETEDVTGTVVDLDARVRNFRATEAALQTVLADADAIDDILAVEDRLTDVRGEIEQLESKASHLREQAAFSTLTIHFGLTPAPVIARQEAAFDASTEAEAATAHLVKVAQAVQKVGIWFGIVWVPILVALGLIGGATAVLAKWFRSRLHTDAPPLEPGQAS